jgi:hypothetical protein
VIPHEPRAPASTDPGNFQKPEHNTITPMTQCGGCGKQYGDDATVCPDDGANLTLITPPIGGPPRRANGGRRRSSVLRTLSLVLIGAGLALALDTISALGGAQGPIGAIRINPGSTPDVFAGSSHEADPFYLLAACLAGCGVVLFLVDLGAMPYRNSLNISARQG